MAESIEYKIVEVQSPTDEELTRVVNETVKEGWRFENFQFAMRESSKRPAMAFIVFTKMGT